MKKSSENCIKISEIQAFLGNVNYLVYFMMVSWLPNRMNKAKYKKTSDIVKEVQFYRARPQNVSQQQIGSMSSYSFTTDSEWGRITALMKPVFFSPSFLGTLVKHQSNQ